MRDRALAFAQSLSDACVEALDGACAAVILYGSLATNEYEAGRSDVDLLVVAEAPLTDRSFERLHRAVSEHEPRAPSLVDLHVTTRDLVERPVPLPPGEAVFEIFPGRTLYVERGRIVNRDLVVQLFVSKRHGVALYGTDPHVLVGEVPDAWVRDVGEAVIDDWIASGSDPADATYTVFTTCRIWRFAEEACHCSKVAAAEWAVERDPTLDVVRHALRARRGDDETPLDPGLVAALLRDTRDRIAASAQ